MKIYRILMILTFVTGFAMFQPGFVSAQENTETITTGEVWEQSSQEEVIAADSSGNIKTQEGKESKKKKDKDVIKLNADFFINLLIDVCSVLLIIFLIYYPMNKKLGYIFTFILFNVVIFLLTYVLNEVKISMGAAFGLFAVFSMLRYRTSGISMKDMTYLFIFIAIGLISAIRLEFHELIIINSILIVFIFILDSRLILKRESSRKVLYDNLDMILPERREELIEDLKKRTGFNIHRVVIGQINLLKDSAVIKIYFYE